MQSECLHVLKAQLQRKKKHYGKWSHKIKKRMTPLNDKNSEKLAT